MRTIEHWRKIINHRLIEISVKNDDIWYLAYAGDKLLTLKKEEDIYKPLKFSLAGKKEGTHETIGRRYVNAEKALLHMFNDFNENACIRNRYNNLEEVIQKLYREGRSA